MNGQQIAEARKKMRLSQTQFGKQLGVSRGSVHSWESGKGEPTRHHRQALADLLGVDVEKMNHVATTPPTRAARLRSRSLAAEGLVPLYRSVAEATSAPWDFRLTGEVVDMVNAPSQAIHRKDLRAFDVPTDVMYPRYMVGETVYISKARVPKEGDFVVVMRKNHDGHAEHSEDATLGRVIKLGNPHIELEQYKPARKKRIKRSDIADIWRIVPPSEF